MKFNKGKFEGNKYIKRVSFSKAVLWKNKEISLPPIIVHRFKTSATTVVMFEDERKNERWSASVSELERVGQLKKEGQEPQFYYPIAAFKVSKIKEVASVPSPVWKPPSERLMGKRKQSNENTLL